MAAYATTSNAPISINHHPVFTKMTNTNMVHPDAAWKERASSSMVPAVTVESAFVSGVLIMVIQIRDADIGATR